MSSCKNTSTGCGDIISLDLNEEEDKDDDEYLWLACGEEDEMDEGSSYTSIKELEKQLLEITVHSEEEAYKLYCDYAHVMGFSVRKSKQYYFYGTKKIRAKIFCCSKEGVRDEKGETSGIFNKLESRTGCQAMIYFTCDDKDQWNVTKFIKEHNHEMAQPYERNLLRSVRLASATKGRIIDSMELWLANSDKDEENIICLHCKGGESITEGSFNSYIEELEINFPGQVVHSEEEAYELYCEYGRLKGFSVRRSKQYYFVGTNKVKWKTYCCSKEGVKNEKESINGPNCNKIETRTGCKAKISFSCDNTGQWKVTTFVKEHNHEMAKPHERHFLRSVCSNVKEQVLNPAHSYKSLGDEFFALQPYEGMMFESIDAANSYYNEYATHLGFATCTLGCNKEENCDSIKDIFNHVENSQGCKAMILLKPGRCGKWTVIKFVKEHNHPLLLLSRRVKPCFDEKDKKIQDLSVELRNKRRLCAMYKDQLFAITKVVEEYGDQISKNVGFVVNNLKEIAPLGEELSSSR